MKITVGDLELMDRTGLLEIWSGIIEEAPPRRLSTPFLRRILAFEIQARREGGLSAATRKKLARPEESTERPKSAQLQPGARLVREWNGVSHVVDVTEAGVLWRGTPYRSLSAVAREITGAHWSGPRFFGLQRGAA